MILFLAWAFDPPSPSADKAWKCILYQYYAN